MGFQGRELFRVLSVTLDEMKSSSISDLVSDTYERFETKLEAKSKVRYKQLYLNN